MKRLVWLCALVSLQAQAAGKLIFACTDAQGRQVRVTEHGGKFRYRFGKPQRAELVFEDNKRAAVARSPKWNGIGRELWTTLVLQNGAYRYALFSSLDRVSEAHPMEYGVTVHRVAGGEEDFVRQVLCSKKHKIVADFPEEVRF